MQAALCIGVIVTAVLLFWFGIAGKNSDKETIQGQIQEAERLYAKQNLADANQTLRSNSNPNDAPLDGKYDSDKLRGSGKGIVNRVFFFEFREVDKSWEKQDPRDLMNLHLRALRGKTFVEKLTKNIESSQSAEKMLLKPFKAESIILGNVQIVQSLFSPTISSHEDGKLKVSITVQARNETAADLFIALFKRSYLMMLEDERESNPLVPALNELTQSLRRKKEEVESIRAQIHKQQAIKPVSSVEEIAIRAELNQCEDELASSIRQLSDIQEARQNGASTRQMAGLKSLSKNTQLIDYLNNLRQLEKFSNAPSNQTPSVREELKRQIALGEETLQKELLEVITELKKNCDKNLKQRNRLRESLVDIAKGTDKLHKDSPQFKLLEIREKELETLKNRYQNASEQWGIAKNAILVNI